MVARSRKSAGSGFAVEGGGPNAPKPSSVRSGATVSAFASAARPAPGVDVYPEISTIRLSISTKVPDIGRSDQRMPADGDVLRHGEAGERPVGRERGQMLRLLPGQAAAEAASAAPQFHRHQVVIGLRQTGTGET